MILMKDVPALLICMDKLDIKNKETGEVSTMYRVTYALETSPYDGHYGPTIIESTAYEKYFSVLQSKIGKRVKINISEMQIFGKKNEYKKVVSLVDDVKVRNK